MTMLDLMNDFFNMTAAASLAWVPRVETLTKEKLIYELQDIQRQLQELNSGDRPICRSVDGAKRRTVQLPAVHDRSLLRAPCGDPESGEGASDHIRYRENEGTPGSDSGSVAHSDQAGLGIPMA